MNLIDTLMIMHLFFFKFKYDMHTVSFQTFFIWAFKTVVDTWNFSISWDDWLIFIISASNEQPQQQLKYTLLKPDFHSWWFSKMQSGREDILKNDMQ